MAFFHVDYIVPKLQQWVTIPNLRVGHDMTVAGALHAGGIVSTETDYSTLVVTDTASNVDDVTGNALQVPNGGVGVASDSYFGGDVRVAGQLQTAIINSGDANLTITSDNPGTRTVALTGTSGSISAVSGNALQLAGGIGVSGNSRFEGNLRIVGSVSINETITGEVALSSGPFADSSPAVTVSYTMYRVGSFATLQIAGVTATVTTAGQNTIVSDNLGLTFAPIATTFATTAIAIDSGNHEGVVSIGANNRLTIRTAYAAGDLATFTNGTQIVISSCSLSFVVAEV